MPRKAYSAQERRAASRSGWKDLAREERIIENAFGEGPSTTFRNAAALNHARQRGMQPSALHIIEDGALRAVTGWSDAARAVTSDHETLVLVTAVVPWILTLWPVAVARARIAHAAGRSKPDETDLAAFAKDFGVAPTRVEQRLFRASLLESIEMLAAGRRPETKHRAAYLEAAEAARSHLGPLFAELPRVAGLPLTPTAPAPLELNRRRFPARNPERSPA